MTVDERTEFEPHDPEVKALIDRLKADGKLQGKKGDYVVYSGDMEVVAIVSPDDLVKTIRGKIIGGFVQIP